MGRGPEQRVLLEWFIVLGRIFAFVGDAVNLARGVACSKHWRNTLRPNGSALGLRLWKWVVRFGEPIPRHRRWDFWSWLISAGRALRPRDSSGSCATRFAKRSSVGYFQNLVEVGQGHDQLDSARAAIQSEFSERATQSQSFNLSESGVFAGLDERRDAVLRIIVAVLTDAPELGYRRGMTCMACFILSVIEESDIDRTSVELKTFALLATILEVDGTASCVAPAQSGDSVAAGNVVLCKLLHDQSSELASRVSVTCPEARVIDVPWFWSFFSDGVPLSRETLCRMWDCWLLDGNPKVFFRTALWLIQRASTLIMDAPSVDAANELLQVYPESLKTADMQPHEILASIWSVKVKNSQLRKALRDQVSVARPKEQKPKEPVVKIKDVDDVELVAADPVPPSSCNVVVGSLLDDDVELVVADPLPPPSGNDITGSLLD